MHAAARCALAVAGGTLRRGHRPGEPNSFDLAVRLPYSWLDLVLRAGPAVLEDRYFVVDRTAEDTSTAYGGGPSAVELLVFAPDGRWRAATVPTVPRAAASTGSVSQRHCSSPMSTPECSSGSSR